MSTVYNEELYIKAKVVASNYDKEAADLILNGSEVALFLQIKKYAVLYAKVKQKLGYELITKVTEDDEPEKVYNNLMMAEVIIGFGLMCTARFGTNSLDRERTALRWYQWWNRWWAELSEREREDIASSKQGYNTEKAKKYVIAGASWLDANCNITPPVINKEATSLTAPQTPAILDEDLFKLMDIT